MLAYNFKHDVEVDSTYQTLFEFIKITSRYLRSYRKALIDLAEVHLERRGNTANLNLLLWELIGSEYADKLAKIR